MGTKLGGRGRQGVRRFSHTDNKWHAWGWRLQSTLISHHQWEIEQSEGQLILLSNEAELNGFSARLQFLKDAEQNYRLLDREEMEVHEPALHGADKIFKAIHLPGDRVMNCRQFSLLVKQAAQRNGVDFRFDSEITGLQAQGKPQVRLKTGDTQPFDHVVICTESLPREDVLKTGLQTSTARIDSYALSAAIREPLNAPRSAVQDCRSGITIARIGKRLRVCGGAELNKSGTDEHDKRVVNKLFRTLDQYFQAQPITGRDTNLAWQPHIYLGRPAIGRQCWTTRRLAQSGARSQWLDTGNRQRKVTIRTNYRPIHQLAE